jgi:F0F1-type ATP synthase assembly protein I
VPDDPNRPAKRNALVSAARYSEIGFVIPAAVFLGYGLGRLFDKWMHTHWLYLAGVVFGAVVGFAQMIRMASALSRE